MKHKNSRLEENVLTHIKDAGVNSVLVGFSGGADSTALLLALVNLKIKCIAVHCNFHLRGEDSDNDARHCIEFCKRLGIELISIEFNVDEYIKSKGSGTSVEMACRELRYREFENILKERRFDRIAVAHNADDNIETLFLNLFRGSGVTGLRGMLPDTGTVLRPLLNITRKEIESYLKDRNVGYVTDITNLSSDYRRNFIRLELLPKIETRWKGVRRAITTTLENLRTEENVIKWSEQNLLAPTVTYLSYKEIAESPDKFWIIYKFMSRFGFSRDIALEVFDVYKKRAGSQTIVGKRWIGKSGEMICKMKGLQYNSFC